MTDTERQVLRALQTGTIPDLGDTMDLLHGRLVERAGTDRMLDVAYRIVDTDRIVSEEPNEAGDVSRS